MITKLLCRSLVEVVGTYDWDNYPGDPSAPAIPYLQNQPLRHSVFLLHKQLSPECNLDLYYKHVLNSRIGVGIGFPAVV